jgi:hypothetical protein
MEREKGAVENRRQAALPWKERTKTEKAVVTP